MTPASYKIGNQALTGSTQAKVRPLPPDLFLKKQYTDKVIMVINLPSNEVSQVKPLSYSIKLLYDLEKTSVV